MRRDGINIHWLFWFGAANLEGISPEILLMGFWAQTSGQMRKVEVHAECR
jgi:hypothetical protein